MISHHHVERFWSKVTNYVLVSRLWDAVGGFLFLFANMQDKLSKHSSQVELLKELLNLQKDMVIMMLSMLEGISLHSSVFIQLKGALSFSYTFVFFWSTSLLVIIWLSSQSNFIHRVHLIIKLIVIMLLRCQLINQWMNEFHYWYTRIFLINLFTCDCMTEQSIQLHLRCSLDYQVDHDYVFVLSINQPVNEWICLVAR